MYIAQEKIKVGTSLVEQNFQDLLHKNYSYFNKKNDSNFVIWDACSIQKSYENNINPYNWTSSHFGSTIQVGVMSSYTENELLGAFRTKLNIDGTYFGIDVPTFNPQGITYYQDSPLVWIWLSDGSSYFDKNGNQVNSAFLGNQYDGTSYDINLITEIIEAIQNNVDITFPVGGAVKIYDFTNNSYIIYLCSTHTANTTKHQGDFPIFLSWCLYQRSVITDDGTLGRDLKANGATVDSIIKKIKTKNLCL